jgi:hypothetical protein
MASWWPLMRAARLPLVLFCAAALACSTAACSGGTHKAAPKSTTSRAAAQSTTSAAPKVTVRLAVTTQSPRSVMVGAPASSNAPLTAVKAVVIQYLELASRDPLQRGPVSRTLASLFSGAAAVSVTPGTEGAIADSGLGPVRKSTTIQAALRLTTLVGADRGIAAVDATLHTSVVADIATTRVSIVRVGDLLLMPAGNRWQIVGYNLVAQRTNLTSGATTTTTASGGSKP